MVGPLLIGGKTGMQDVGEEKEFEDSEKNEKLNHHQSPQGTPQTHRAETLAVERKQAQKTGGHGKFVQDFLIRTVAAQAAHFFGLQRPSFSAPQLSHFQMAIVRLPS